MVVQYAALVLAILKYGTLNPNLGQRETAKRKQRYRKLWEVIVVSKNLRPPIILRVAKKGRKIRV
jgi:hypothetical protein